MTTPLNQLGARCHLINRMFAILKTKIGELIFVVAFLAFLFAVASIPLERHWKLFAVVIVSLIGVVTYIFLYRERYRGRWLKAAFAFIIGLVIGAGVMALRR